MSLLELAAIAAGVLVLDALVEDRALFVLSLFGAAGVLGVLQVLVLLGLQRLRRGHR